MKFRRCVEIVEKQTHREHVESAALSIVSDDGFKNIPTVFCGFSKNAQANKLVARNRIL